MNRLGQVSVSRQIWKSKAVDRGLAVRRQKDNNRRNLKAAAQREAKLKWDIVRLVEENERLRRARQPKAEVIYLALLLFCSARISFRGVARILGVLGQVFGWTIQRSPQTIINYVQRLVIVRLRKPPLPAIGDCSVRSLFSNGWIWIVDTTVFTANGSALAVVAIPADFYSDADKEEKTLGLKDVAFVAGRVRKSWNGDSVREFLEDMISIHGRPSAILRDQGSDLQRAGRLMSEDGIDIDCIRDISHFVANIIRMEYDDHEQLHSFMSILGKISTKVKQTVLGFFAPPSRTTKARYMNIYRLLKWAQRILALNPSATSPAGFNIKSDFEQVKVMLRPFKGFIERCGRDVEALMNLEKILKTQGLSHDSWQKAEACLDPLPPLSRIRRTMKGWAEETMAIADKMGVGDSGLPVTSDPIESLFGLSKSHGTGERQSIYRMATRLPALTGEVTMAEAELVSKVTVAEQKAVFGDVPSFEKNQFTFRSGDGSFDDLASTKEMIMTLSKGQKSAANSEENNIITVGYKNSESPQKSPSASSLSPADSRILLDTG